MILRKLTLIAEGLAASVLVSIRSFLGLLEIVLSKGQDFDEKDVVFSKI